MTQKSVDLVTIGAGGGAYPAAFKLARKGRTVLMVDPKGVMSGNCLAEGCVPSKAVREIAHLLVRQKRLGEAGAKGTLTPDFRAIMDHKDRVQNLRYAQHAEELSRTPGLTLVKGTASLVDGRTVRIRTAKGEEDVAAGHILIASGSDVLLPPIPGSELCVTSHHLFRVGTDFRDLPRRMIIIGGGYIGLETACMFSAFGTAVTLFEKGPLLLPGMERALVDRLRPLLDPSITIRTNADVREVRNGPEGKIVVLGGEGPREEHKADVVLLAAGRRPVFPEGLEQAGVVTDRSGIRVDNALRTSSPGIFAAGDVNGRTPLFHAAVRQSLAVANTLLAGGEPADTVDFSSVPTTIFTLPGASYVGLLPESARKTGVDLVETRYDFSEDSRAQILNEMEGEIRLYFEKKTHVLKGGWVVGIDAGNLIGEIGLAVSAGLSARELSRFADQHPMASEGIGKAARQLV
jgi:dihydrolipoamide dehydrogenase